MTETEIRTALANVLASDRSLSVEVAGELAARYLDWRAELPKREVLPWEDRKARRYVEGTWLSEGRPSVVFAGQGRGKSNFAAFVIEKVLETRPAWDVYTNLPFAWDPDGDGPAASEPWGRVRPVSRLSELLRGAAGSVRAGRKPAVVIDEMDQAVTSHSWASEEAQSWQKLVNIERHLRIRGPLLVYHAYRHVPVVLREGTMLKSLLQVIIKDRARWVIRREEEGFLQVPSTVLPYLAYGLRGFDVDVDVGDLEKHLSGSGERVAGQVLAYLEAHRPAREVASERRAAKQERDEEIIRAFVEDPGLTVREAKRRFNAGSSHLVELRSVAQARRGTPG
jgi:hypothetical protein